MEFCRYSRIAASSGKTAEAAGREKALAPAAAAATVPSFEDIHRCASVIM